MSQEDYKVEIDKWLKNIDNWTSQKTWQVVSALNSELQLRGQTVFKIPHDKFINARITNKNNLEAVLSSLHNKKIITVLRKLGDFPPSDDPDDPTGSKWTTITEQPNIINFPDTQIRILIERFIYLRDKLHDKVKKQSSISNKPVIIYKREAKRRITALIRVRRLGKKEAKFLNLLADLEPKTISWLTNEIPTKDCKHLKGRVKVKIKGTDWNITTYTARGLQKDSFYQLVYLPLKKT